MLLNVTSTGSRQTRNYRTILFRRNSGVVDGTVIELRAKSTLRDNISLGKQPGHYRVHVRIYAYMLGHEQTGQQLHQLFRVKTLYNASFFMF